MIDHKNRVIFVHVAKTGGSSITHLYGQATLQECRDVSEEWNKEELMNGIIYPIYNAPYDAGVHDDIGIIEKGVKKVHKVGLDYYHKFAVIRRPAEYVKSCWNEWHQERFPSFNNFVDVGWFKGVINPQIRGHLMIGNDIMMDRIFLFEQLHLAFEHVKALTDYHDLPEIHSNRKKHKGGEYDIPAWVEKKINDHFWEDNNIYQTLRRNTIG